VPKNARDKELARAALKREEGKRAARRKKSLTNAVIAIVTIGVVVIGAYLLVGRRGGATGSSAAASPSASTAPSPTKSSDKPSGAPPMTIDAKKTYTAALDTSFGTINILLSPETAPVTVNNFVYLADKHKYDGVLFHRVVSGFMIQGGDVTCRTPSATCGQGGPGYEFADELTGDEKYTPGVVAMANAGPDTNGSQFFIVTGPQAAQLPPSYTIFGKVADAASLKVAEKIQDQPVDGETPKTPIVINSVKIATSGGPLT